MNDPADIDDVPPVLRLPIRTPAEVRAYHDGYRAALASVQRTLIELSGDPLLAAEPYAAINDRLDIEARASALIRAAVPS